MNSRRRAGLVGALVSLASAAAFASGARAADRVYWSNAGADKISFANLDGSGGGDLATTGATASGPQGVALDPATGRIYWANRPANKISFANLDSSGGGGDLATGLATVSNPIGVAIDPTSRRIYWANATTISFANLDGSGGGDLVTTGAKAISSPQGVAIDPAGGRIYWANESFNTISFAKLDGTGGGDLATNIPMVNDPMGVALDASAGRIYWANHGGNTIGFSNRDGMGSGQLATTQTVSFPEGVALDTAAGRIYWSTNADGTISFANLNGSGGGGVVTTGATPGLPKFLALLETPRGAGTPAITGGSSPGSVLSCSQGSWAGDLPGAFLYRAPKSFAFQWSLNGSSIAGAGGSTFTALVAGQYRCSVTASNAAGSTGQTSAPLTIGGPVSLRPPSSRTIAKISTPRETNSIFAVGPSSTPLIALTAAKRHKRGTVFSFTLNQPALVKIAIRMTSRGRRVGRRRRCQPDTRKLRHKPRCTRTVTIATLTRVAHTGLNKVPFSGRVRGKALKSGGYKAVFTAIDTAGTSKPKTLSFTVARR